MDDIENRKNHGGTPPWQNYNAWIAILAGAVLLFISYYMFQDKERFPHEATHEIGFALVVAVFIWAIFEVASRQETERSWNDRIDRITKNVFFGVLGNNLSRAFINEARIVAIEQDFERKDFHVTYRLAERKFRDSLGNEVEFVILRATGVFKIKNISTQKKIYPIAVALPNPLVDEMKLFCEIHDASVKDANGVTHFRVDAANIAMQEKMKDDSLYQIECNIENIGLIAGEEVEVKIEYTLAKESEDTEIVQTRYPTSSIVINLIDTTSPNRAVQARAIHRVPITVDSSGAADGCHVYRMTTPLLPYQGFAIFWKKVPIRAVAAGTRGTDASHS